MSLRGNVEHKMLLKLLYGISDTFS
jgi:hypothetical protein